MLQTLSWNIQSENDAMKEHVRNGDFRAEHFSTEALTDFRNLYKQLFINDDYMNNFARVSNQAITACNLILNVVKKYSEEVNALGEDTEEEYFTDLLKRLQDEDYDKITLESLWEIPSLVEMFLDNIGIRDIFPNNLVKPF
jgi:hypothetical protein